MKKYVEKLYLVRDKEGGLILHASETIEGAEKEIENLENWCIVNNCFTPNTLEVVEVKIADLNKPYQDISLDDIIKFVRQKKIEEFEKDFPF